MTDCDAYESYDPQANEIIKDLVAQCEKLRAQYGIAMIDGYNKGKAVGAAERAALFGLLREANVKLRDYTKATNLIRRIDAAIGTAKERT